MKKTFVIAGMLLFGGFAATAGEPASLRLPTRDAQTFVSPDGRTWSLRHSHALPNGDFALSFTPEPRSQEKWTEMFTYRFVSSGMTADEVRLSMEKAKEFDEGVEFTVDEVAPTGFIVRVSAPQQNSRSILRVIQQPHGAYALSYEDRRQADGAMTWKEWDAILSSASIEVETAGQARPDNGG